MSTTASNQSSNTMHAWSSNVWVQLLKFKASNDQKSFNNLMLDAMPELEKYVASRLRLAHHRETLPDGKYEVSDFTNALFVAAYDNFSKFNSARDFTNWLYIKIDELIEDQVAEEDYDDFFFRDFGNYSKKEWTELEQKVAAADKTGKVTLNGNTTAISDSGKKVLAAIFKSDNERQHLETIRNQIAEKEINSHLDVVMKHLPKESALALNLAHDQGVAPQDVAVIQKKSEGEVKADLKKSKTSILDSFVERYRDIVF
ncbi:hypothetical protein DNU06_05810 [Putridiphycobacter roseus]|uniref:Sigma-70 family RNA polymerase sigma factor n=1 Tax=Putridiphycobacter roseus TaxID=2219161 RepID=A0A2W1N4U8_9FLAO|nr:hypothetical protein [Putridiphycobacter roseus]PZE18131.1 hypothetical protein DNU06_05810 [Putridiphycobacter roseus]